MRNLAWYLPCDGTICYTLLSSLQPELEVAEDSSSQHSDSDSEEPSPEALARYLAMRRHTVGVGDSRHEVPEDVRVKLANNQPIIASPQPNLFRPLGFFPHVNLPNTLPYVPNETSVLYEREVQDQNLLQPPNMYGAGEIDYIINSE